MPTAAQLDTSMGMMVVQLYESEVPNTTANFVHLASRGFYDGLTFHRVIKDFMLQGGDPLGNGTGGPGYRFADEFDPSLKHDKPGILSMANAGPNTNGSQFFITLAPTPWLNNKHTIFGEVVEGLDVLKAIGLVKTGKMDRPLEPVVIKKLTIKRVEK